MRNLPFSARAEFREIPLFQGPKGAPVYISRANSHTCQPNLKICETSSMDSRTILSLHDDKKRNGGGSCVGFFTSPPKKLFIHLLL